jgi:hypothetical protein
MGTIGSVALVMVYFLVKRARLNEGITARLAERVVETKELKRGCWTVSFKGFWIRPPTH